MSERNTKAGAVVGILIVLAAGWFFWSEPTSPSEPAQNIVGSRWLWRGTLMSNDAEFLPDANNSFSVTLGPDGRAAITTDCNNGNGSYTLEGDSLTFGPFAMTRKYCAGSQETAFVGQLSQVQSYFFRGPTMYMQLKFDSGVMEYIRPVN